ncbi:FAD binding domain-containing protein [Undibacterium sp. TC4M20W]|uniref:FAD binding domain-containing protein n=1 Tax=unclassified Undibacterium TaxID=2630295 RepID=UPI003BF04567
MNSFSFSAPEDVAEALRQVGIGIPGETKFIAGGTNLIDLMKEHVETPVSLVDISQLPLSLIEPSSIGGLLIGAMVRNADTAYHPLVRQHYPLLSHAILSGASAQIRNMASNGGNLLQRTRCVYFYDVAVPCNKRRPGSGCPAIAGLNRQHAILGTSEMCIATHPSDMCVALAALQAIVHVRSVNGSRQIAFSDFHRLPGDRPDMDTSLAEGELITHIELPPAQQFVNHCTYLKLRDRASYAFALVSVAVALDIADDGSINEARIALGGVAHKPWRLPEAEALLAGELPTSAAFVRVADYLLKDAQGQGNNNFKLSMAHRAIIRALELAAASSCRQADVAGVVT